MYKVLSKTCTDFIRKYKMSAATSEVIPQKPVLKKKPTFVIPKQNDTPEPTVIPPNNILPKKKVKPQVTVITKPVEAPEQIKIPAFSEKERNNYIRQKDNAHFSSPEEEYVWAETQFKTCTKCGIHKSLNCYNGNTSGRDAFDKSGYRLRRPECEDCTKKASQGKTEAQQIAKKEGIPFKAPEGTTCEICKKAATKGNGLVFDHCHKKNVFRGYVCNSCNRSLGVLGDDIQGLIIAMNYLLKSEPTKIIQDEDGQLKIAP
jgi:hypothetical protein